MSILATAVVPLLLLALALQRARADLRGGQRFGPRTGFANPLTQLLLALGLAKACRIRHVTDHVINPKLQEWTGIANIMSLAGMTFGALATIPLVALTSYITGRNFAPRWQLASAVVIVAAMAITFSQTPMAEIPTEYMSNDFEVTGPVLAYWIAYLAPLTIAVILCGIFAARELTWVRTGPFAAALAGIALAALLGLVYVGFKIVNLVLKDRATGGFWLEHAEFVSIALGLASIAAAGSAAGVYAWWILKDRIHRYRLLRLNGDRWMEARATNPDVVLDPGFEFRATRRRCWSASRSSEAAYRLQIELADHAHQLQRSPSTSQATS